MNTSTEKTEKKEKKTAPAKPKETKPRVRKTPAPVEADEKTPPPVVEETEEIVIPDEKIPEDDGTGDGKGKKPDRYFEGVGRRKTAVARVRLFTKPGDFKVNDKLYTEYFKTIEQTKNAEEALQKMKLFGRFRVSVKTMGGGLHAQSEAIRHGLARCLVKFNPDFRKRLKRAGYLRRDPRMKERKKFGLKKARRAPQWAKR